VNQLTTTNNINYFDKKSRYVTHQFKLEESLIERIFESCGYKFTIITLRNSEPYFIAKEVSEALGYSVASNLVKYFRKYDLDILTLTNENGLDDLKDAFKKNASPISAFSARLVLIPASSLQEYLLRHSTRPKAKVVADKLYQALAGGNPVFEEKVLDDWGTSLDELQKTVPQLFDASKKVNGFIFGLIRNNRVAGRIVQGYHNTTMSNFVHNVDAVRRKYKEMGVSSTLLSSRRVFLGYLDFVSRQVISFIDDMFIKEVSEMIADWKAQGFTDKQISNSVFKKKDKTDKPIVQIVKFVIEKHSHVIKTLYWMDEEGMMEEKKEQFMNSQYVTNNDRQIHGRLVLEDWSASKLLDKTIHKLIEREG
jgi:hypothetical protein